MCGGGCPVLGILAMAPQVGMGSSVSTRTFATSFNISDKAQKKLGESNHPIGRTRLMQIMMQSSYGNDETRYVNAPTWDNQRGPWWQAFMTSILNPGGAFCGICLQYCLEDAWKCLSKLYRLQSDLSICNVLKNRCTFIMLCQQIRIRFGWNCSWGTATMRKKLSFSPNIRTASDSGRRMLNPYYTLQCNSPWMNTNLSGVNADAWGPFLIAFYRASLDQGGPVLTGITSST